MTIPDTIKLIVALIIMMNPLGSLTIFLDLTHKFTLIEQRQIARTTAWAMMAIMLITLWSGEKLLFVLGITIPSFRVAGGIILLLSGLSMLQSRESPVNHVPDDDKAAKHKSSIAVVPMALPVLVGPGTISTLIIAAGDYPQMVNKIWMTGICLFLAAGVGMALYFASPIAKFLGVSVIKVVTRIMGMIIMAIAVGMLSQGLIGLLPALA